MANHELPRRGSMPHLTLSALHNMGGEATLQSIMRARNCQRSATHFQSEQIDPLVRCKLVEEKGIWFKVSRDGLKYLGIKIEDENEYQGEVAGPRYNHGIRPLNLAKHFPPRPQRAGADEFRAIPSVMGGKRVEYR